MIILDTSALIRFFVADDKQKSEQVARLLECGEELFISEAVVTELTFVLAKLYQSSRTDIVKMLRFLISRPNMALPSEVKSAVKIYTENNISMVDCLVVAHAQSSEKNQIASFDKQLLKLSKVKAYWN